MKKFIFFTAWIILLILVPVTVFRTTPFALALKNPVTITNYLQRLLGLTLYTLLFVQLISGAFMLKLTEKFGGWIFPFHVFEGILIYLLALLHPIAFLLFGRFVGSGFDPIFVFLGVCLLCKTPLEYYYTLGRISFWLLTIGVIAAEFRTAAPWLRVNWRKLHVLNYIAFLLVGLHGFFIGTDFKIQPFYTFAVVSYVIVAGMVAFIEIPRLSKNFRKWIRN